MNRLTVSVVVAFCASIAAQSTSSTTFSPSSRLSGAGGGRATSSSFRIDASLGGAAVPPRMTSGNYVLLGGFSATLEVPTAGRPWLVATVPPVVDSRSASRLTLLGTQLDANGTPGIEVEGRAAVVRSVSGNRVDFDLPLATPPGPRLVTLVNTSERVDLPRGIRLLPEISTWPAPPRNELFDLHYHGHPGDQVLLALSLAPAGTPLALAGAFYELRLDVGLMVVLPTLTVSHPSGRLVLRSQLPAGAPLYCQALAFSSTGAYRPASFTNVIRL